MNKIWSDYAWDDYIYWQGQDKKTLKKINELLKDINRNGYKCKGKPEPLKGDLSGFWSVHIDNKKKQRNKEINTIVRIIVHVNKRTNNK